MLLVHWQMEIAPPRSAHMKCYHLAKKAVDMIKRR